MLEAQAAVQAVSMDSGAEAYIEAHRVARAELNAAWQRKHRAARAALQAVEEAGRDR